MEIEGQGEQVADEVDNEQQYLHPYQLTVYYQNELLRFNEAFQLWVNDRYELERRNFEQQQEQHYHEARLVADGQRRQQHQAEHNNVPLVEDIGNENNNNIIIDDE